MEDDSLDLTALLLDVALHRNKTAFAQLFRYFSPKIRHFGIQHLNSEARAMELVQETLMSVWQKAALYNPDKGAATTWIYTVMRNQCFDMLRRQQSNKEELLSDDLWPVMEAGVVDEGHADPGENDILTRQLAHYLKHLPEPQREIVSGVYLQDQTLQELAERYDIPLGTVKSRLRLALGKLRELLVQEQQHD